MISNVVGTLVFLAVFGIVVSSPDGGLDCRKFVFAPLCRGVAAKRDYISPGRYEPFVFNNEESMKYLMESLYSTIEAQQKELEENRIRTSAYRQLKFENLLKKYQQEQSNRFLRQLFAYRRSNSERNNLPEMEFENL